MHQAFRARQVLSELFRYLHFVVPVDEFTLTSTVKAAGYAESCSAVPRSLVWGTVALGHLRKIFCFPEVLSSS